MYFVQICDWVNFYTCGELMYTITLQLSRLKCDMHMIYVYE